MANNAEYPVGFYFSLSFEGENAAFKEISGISKELGMEEVAGGGENRFKYRLPTVSASKNLVLKRPNFVKIQWGSNLVFYRVLKSFDTTFTLFKPDGNPLGAKILLSFRKYISPDKRTKEDSESSPDISHLVEVVQGESLPQLSAKVWSSPCYYIQIAQYNV